MKAFKAWPTYFLYILIFSVFLFAGCLSDQSSGIVPVGGDPLADIPTVTFTDPANNVTGVAINKKISAIFSHSMNPSTITAASFTVKETSSGNNVPGTVTCVDKTAIFTPLNNLASNITYTATITTFVRNQIGNSMTVNYSWSFTTGTSSDATAPTVTSTDPSNGITGVAINKKIAATFSEIMDPATITGAIFKVTGPGQTPVSGTLAYSGLIASFIPSANLSLNTLYTVTITTGIKDLSGNAMASDLIWSFTTGTASDSAAPSVASTDPANNGTGVAVNKKIAATFSEGMDSQTVNAVSFTLKGPGQTPVSGTVTYAGLIANFTPAANLAFNTSYTATITNGVKDLAGNAMAANYAWSFTTGATPDIIAPSIASTDPANNGTGVAINKKIAVTFSEGMDSQTLTNITFTLKGPGQTPVSGTVTYTGLIANFTPANNLAFNTVYTATVTNGVKDLAGNAMAANYTWSFTTSAAPDTIAPTVTSIDPANNGTGVAINKKIAATFSEGMNQATITNITFTLKGPGQTPVSGTITIVGLTANFTPAANLAFNTIYTATITKGVKDLAGNAMAADYSWSFTTSAAQDTTAPVVTSTDPANGLTGVASNKKIAATFSEGMDPSTITNITFTLAGPGQTPVSGTATYVGLIANFTPAADLSFNTTYTAAITMGAKDLAGNAMTANYTWSFTTGIAPDTTAPTAISTNPANGDIDVALNKKINATFSEGMDPATISNITFAVDGVVGTVTYDAATKIATLKPSSSFESNKTYTATITSGARDLAGNAIVENHVWSFTTGLITLAEPVTLGAIAAFGSFGGGAGMTNQGIYTIVNGDIGTTGASSKITGFHDTAGNIYTETPLNIGTVNGTIYTADTPAGANSGALDARTAYNNMSPAALPGGIIIPDGELGGRTLAPGIYKSLPGTFRIQLDDLTLDAGGDANAVWVFQMESSLTVGGPGAAFPKSVIMKNGALAKNVFWQVGSAATINAGGGGTMVGTIIAEAGATFSTPGNVTLTTLNGRAIGLNASVTVVNTIINVPGQ